LHFISLLRRVFQIHSSSFRIAASASSQSAFPPAIALFAGKHTRVSTCKISDRFPRFSNSYTGPQTNFRATFSGSHSGTGEPSSKYSASWFPSVAASKNTHTKPIPRHCGPATINQRLAAWPPGRSAHFVLDGRNINWHFFPLKNAYC
jgi:hypothetical protein